jgi:branched-chain amino acid transport system substrate-binding protein
MKERLKGERRARLWLLLAAVALALAAVAAGCGGGGGEEAATTLPAAETEVPAETGAPAQTGAAAEGTGTPIKIGILSDCEGAFGAFYEQDIGGALTAFVNLAGGTPNNPDKPSDGITGAVVAGHPIEIVGYGCSDDTADKAIEETKRLVEQLGADILIGPLSGDEGIAVANYAKEHPDNTFLNGTSAAQDTTLKVQAPNFFRFNSDGAQWSAGLGDYAYNVLGWRTAATIGDDYSFPYTSLAGFIAEFCAVGGQVTQRIWPPLGETDYSSYVQQVPDDVDGIMTAVGGAGLISFIKAYTQAKGQVDPKKFMGNVFWPDPTILKEIGGLIVGGVAGGPTAGDSTEPAAVAYNQLIDTTFPGIKGTGPGVFTYNYYNAAWALIQGLEEVKGDLSDGQKALQETLGSVALDAPYGSITLDDNRQATTDNYVQQVVDNGDGTYGVKTILKVPQIDQSFGGVFTPETPPPDRENPKCVKPAAPLPWVGNAEEVNFSQ